MLSVSVVEPEHSQVPCIWLKREEVSAGMKFWVRLPSWINVKYCLSKNKTHFIGLLEMVCLLEVFAASFLAP